MYVHEKDLEKAIKIQKFRIKHHEKHGNGVNAMQDKIQLKKQERMMELKYPNHRNSII